MAYNTLPEGGVILRLEFSIADAVHQRGLMSVLLTAVKAWLNRPRMPADLPAYLRADLGLPPAASPAHWLDVPATIQVPPPLRRPGM
jgi:hypothetical protein